MQTRVRVERDTPKGRCKGVHGEHGSFALLPSIRPAGAAAVATAFRVLNAALALPPGQSSRNKCLVPRPLAALGRRATGSRLCLPEFYKCPPLTSAPPFKCPLDSKLVPRCTSCHVMSECSRRLRRAGNDECFCMTRCSDSLDAGPAAWRACAPALNASNASRDNECRHPQRHALLFHSSIHPSRRWRCNRLTGRCVTYAKHSWTAER